MIVELPLQIYQMNVISQARSDYKEYAVLSVERNNKTAVVKISAHDQFNNSEKREILGSLLNYILQLSAMKTLDLEIE
ncbi:hypothetical protein AB4648_01890 [Vibrio splendidus]